MADVVVSDHRSVVLFLPISQEAMVWFDTSVEAAASQWLGAALAVDRRYAPGLMEALVADGFTVEEG